jgi:glycosyltransferase involved in cell wall biosynthesis
VAVVASTFGLGGAERVTGDVLRRLDRARFHAELFFLHDAGVVGRELFHEGFGGSERLAKKRRDRRAVLRLLAHFREFRPHVVWCLDHHDAMTTGRVAGLATGARAMVVASHATVLVGQRRLFDVVDRVLMEFTRRVVAVSSTHARHLSDCEGVDRSRIAVIENGVDLKTWPVVSRESRREARAALGIFDETPVIVVVAGLRPEKAHDVLLGAVARLKADGRRVRVLLAGEGERRGALATLAQSLGIEGDVEFLGVRRDVARLLHASDVAVLPSVTEALPLALLEAMAAGTPVVASAVGSVPELVHDGETGWLTRAGDPVSLARGIGYILDDGARTERIRSQARALVEARYSIEATTRAYEDLFDDVMAA